jgi:hypothetical protein
MSALIASGRKAWAALVDGPEPVGRALAAGAMMVASWAALLGAIALWSGS